MADQDINKVDLEDDYYHIRFNNPDKFDTIRTPDWAENVATSVSEGSEVRMGKLEDEDDWTVQSILIKKEAGKEKSQEQAKEIVRKLQS